MEKKILLIEDEKDMVYAVTMQLRASGYEIIAASDGDEGLKKAKENKPDLILLDIMLPRKDGYTFLLDLKKDEATKSIPVIVVTAKPAMKDIFEMEGVKAYITKPFENTHLLSKIKEIIG
jgi:two-component system alkaline phosphatase synthesis response regulator PhoP